MDLDLGNHVFFGNLVGRNVLSVMMFAWLILDCVIHFPKEYETVWKPTIAERRPSSVSGAYIFTRYAGLIGQTVNFIWTLVLLSKPLVHTTECWQWYGFQSAVIQCLFAALQFVLMLRVSALFFKSWLMTIILSVLWLFERGVILYTAIETFHALELGSACLMGLPPIGPVAFMSATVVGTQFVVWGTTLARHYAVGGPNNPAVRQVIRDGTVTCAAIFTFYVTVISYCYFVEVPQNTMFAFMISLLSVLGPRITLNLLSLGDNVISVSRPIL
ncbi:hypothetical protein FPV67DRAFT_1670392 [Lyophyllum atratum]|nr:hypothetical protein FPV67DRAFT_1670392 [Lyophyllum atratum]